MRKIQITQEISRSVKVDNSCDENRQFDIEGTAYIEHGEVKRIESIEAKIGDRTVAKVSAGGASSAHIIDPMVSASDESNLGITGSFSGDSETPNSVIMAAVENFVNDVIEFIQENE